MAEIAGLNALALAHPVLDLMARDPDFFAIRESPEASIVIVGVVLTLVLPLAIVAGEAGLDRLREGAGGVLHGAVVCVYLSVLALMVIERGEARLDTWTGLVSPAWLMVVAAVGAGVAATLLLRRVAVARSFLRVLGVAAFAVLALFLARAPLGTPALPPSEPVSRPAPVVVLIFDEFPSASMLTSTVRIDTRRMPHFARLARDATWYPAATTVADATSWAVPALLSGRRPRRGRSPTVSNWPANLFTLLRGQYEVRALEPLTFLCPQPTCPDEIPDPADAAWSLLGDSAKLALRTASPQEYARRLPPVAGQQGVLTDPDRQVARLLEFLRPGRRPLLAVAHLTPLPTTRGTISPRDAATKPRARPTACRRDSSIRSGPATQSWCLETGPAISSRLVMATRSWVGSWRACGRRASMTAACWWLSPITASASGRDAR